MSNLPLIEVEELPACQWVASLERAIKAPATFEKLWGDIHKAKPVYGCIVYEPINDNLNLEW